MTKTGARRLLAVIATIAAVGAANVALAAPAFADTVAAPTTCTNAFAAPQAGPSSFDVDIPSTVVAGQPVPVTVTFAFTNSSSFRISDIDRFTQTIATTGPAANPLTVTAGSRGPLAAGATYTITESGTWTPDAAGTATFTLGDFSFRTRVFGLDIPVSCSFDSVPPAVTRTVTAP